MSKRSSFRQHVCSQRVNGSQTLLKIARHHFYTTVLLIWDKLSWKKLLLVTFQVLVLFVNTLTPDDMYSRKKRENFLHQYQMPSSLKPKTFSSFFVAFLNSTLNSEYFERKDKSHSLSILESIGSKRDGYVNVQTFLFRQPFRSQCINGSQTLLKSGKHHFYTTIPLILDNLNWKKLLLVRIEILGLFVNTLTADEKYSRNIGRISRKKSKWIYL